MRGVIGKRELVELGLSPDLWAGGAKRKRTTRPTPKTKERECASCSEILSKDTFPRLAACTHEPDTCKQCLEMWVETQLNIANWDRIACPSEGCSQLLSHDSLKDQVAEELYNR